MRTNERFLLLLLFVCPLENAFLFDIEICFY